MRAAIALLFILCCFIKSFTLSATARLSAAACTSSCKRCFFRKLSKLLPRCLFLFLAAFDVGIFSSQSQSSVLLWRFLCLLDKSMQQDDSPSCTKNNVRAIRVGSLLRTSQMPDPK